LMSFCANAQPPYPKYVAEALYWRACLSNSGEFPDLVPQNPRTAFRDFEAAARAGHFQAWFRLGRDYETVGDAVHARDCFERGVKYQVESCLYRMGMANLLGQLGLPARPEVAVPLLHRAATLATVTAPQPAYVFGLLLIDQFAQVSIPSHLLVPHPKLKQGNISSGLRTSTLLQHNTSSGMHMNLPYLHSLSTLFCQCNTTAWHLSKERLKRT
jgi:hypothetical protein